MICLAVIEQDLSRISLIKDWLIAYTIMQNCELDTLWFVDNDPIPKVQKYASKMQIALINLDSQNGSAVGKALYEKNPDCRILYYRSSPCSLLPLLETRPISFFLWPDGKADFLESFDAVYKEVLFSQTTFRYETKSRLFLLPKRSILYFQSDLRYVDIHMVYGEKPRVLAKLSDIELLAGDAFVRIHKSYLVNAKHILWVDKKNHMVQLSNGEQLPMSDAQYDNACQRIGVMK